MTIYMIIGIIIFILFVAYLYWLSNQEDKKYNIERKNIDVYTKNENTEINKNTEYTQQQEHQENKSYDNSIITNKVALKFTTVSSIIQVIGYTIAILYGLWAMVNVSFFNGLIIGVIIGFTVFFSTLLYEAIAEIINLLQDIKNKM